MALESQVLASLFQIINNILLEKFLLQKPGAFSDA